MRTDTKNIAATVAYLIGIRKSAWIASYGNDCPDLLAKLDSNQHAAVIRYLSKLRTTLMQRFKKTDDSIRYDFKNIDRIDFYDHDNIVQLQKWGFEIVLANKRASDYTLHFNKLIAENIDSCRELFPDWINWEYIKDLFILPKFTQEKFQKLEFEKYMENIESYPFQVYIHWEPQSVGNILYNDGKFLEYIYAANDDFFGDKSKYKNAVDDVKNNIYNFIGNSHKTVLAVDCENSDVYKLYGMLKNLNKDEIDKIHKIILFDDAHTNNGWDFLQNFTSIPVEHIEVERVTDWKSLVDMRMASGVCKEFYKDDVSSFIILSSDSDYWGLISSLPDAEFLVVIEYSKCGQAIKETLDSHGIYYCSLDDFCTGNIEDFKRAVLINELKTYLPNLLSYNGKELASKLFEQARIEADEPEISNFYEKYIKTLKLKVDPDGNFTFVVAS